MTKLQVRDLALKKGFQLKLQPNGGMDLDLYVYEFAEALVSKVREELEVTPASSVDMVNEPPHYKQGEVGCIDGIKSALTEEEWRGYCKGNAIKYIWRERHKGQAESLAKAQWYLNKLGEGK